VTEPQTKDFRSDQQLIDALNRGDHSAFDTIYERYHRWVQHVALRFVSNEADALDAMQEVFGYLARHASQLTLTAKLTTYLYPIVRSQAINIIRKRNRRENLPIEDLGRLTAPAADADVLHHDLATLVRDLPEPQREVLLMKALDGMTQDEIATALGIAVGTVKSRLHRAIDTLKRDPRTRQYFENK